MNKLYNSILVRVKMSKFNCRTIIDKFLYVTSDISPCVNFKAIGQLLFSEGNQMPRHITRKRRLPATANLSPAWEQDEMLMNQ